MPPVFMEVNNMSRKSALDFLERHGMAPSLIEPMAEAEKMAAEMERGLAGRGGSLPMIPTYLCLEGAMPQGEPVVVIDAGGTNFRSALVRFEEGGCRVEALQKRKMPGTDKPAAWEEFISFVADGIEPLMDRTERIGFCFSYSAEITPEIDGRVIRIDKEVTVTGSAGQLVGAALIAELERRGIRGKKAVIINDTAAVLLGGTALLDRDSYSGFIGQVSGTGTNTCCVLPAGRIGKLGMPGEKGMIINLESGMYNGISGGDFDRLLDSQSNNPGLKALEKLTAGVYLGELCRLMLRAAAEEGLLSPAAGQKVQGLERIDSAVIDAWGSGENMEEVCATAEDEEFVKTICLAVFERSARCMCANLTALLLLTGAGRERPACICAEGSLVQKGRIYRPMLEKLLARCAGEALGRKYDFRIGQETTLPGSAAAALLNI